MDVVAVAGGAMQRPSDGNKSTNANAARAPAKEKANSEAPEVVVDDVVVVHEEPDHHHQALDGNRDVACPEDNASCFDDDATVGFSHPDEDNNVYNRAKEAAWAQYQSEREGNAPSQEDVTKAEAGSVASMMTASEAAGQLRWAASPPTRPLTRPPHLILCLLANCCGPCQVARAQLRSLS
jgi:hypothetical protein